MQQKRPYYETAEDALHAMKQAMKYAPYHTKMSKKELTYACAVWRDLWEALTTRHHDLDQPSLHKVSDLRGRLKWYNNNTDSLLEWINDKQTFKLNKRYNRIERR